MSARPAASRNVETHRAAHEAFNRRDLDAVVRAFAPEIAYTDHPRGVTVKTPVEFRDWLGEWVTGFSDAEVSEAEYIAAGDASIARFISRGTNDGPLGELPARGARMAVPMCEILHFDSKGRVVRGEVFYDQMTILTQLGHASPTAT